MSTRGLSAPGVVAVVLGLLLLAPAAQAASTRNFDAELTGLAPPGAPYPGRLSEPEQVAVDGAGDIWVGSYDNSAREAPHLSEYDSAGGYLSQLTSEAHLTSFGNCNFGACEETHITGLALGYPSGQAAQTVYVGTHVNRGNHNTNEQFLEQHVEIFDADGAFSTTLEPGIGNGNGNAPHAFVAIDHFPGPSQGRLYVTVNDGGQAIEAFEPGGTAPHDFEGCPTCSAYVKANKITGTPAGEFTYYGAEDVAVGPNGNIYVANYDYNQEYNSVDEFRPSGEFVREFALEVPTGPPRILKGIAVDPTNGNLLVTDQRGVIDEFSPSDAFLGQIAGPPGAPLEQPEYGIAFDSNGYLYVVSHGCCEIENHNPNYIVKFLPLGVGPLPQVTTNQATGVQRTSATLHAEVGEEGSTKVTRCRFEYVSAADYRPWEGDPYAGPTSGTAPCRNSSGVEVGTESKPIESETPIEVHADLAEIHAGTDYHFRISASNSESPAILAYGTDQTFQTPVAVNNVQTGSFAELTNESATLHGSFTAEEEAGTQEYFFKYGTSSNYGRQTPAGTLPVHAPGQVELPIESLLPGTTYHYRLFVTNKYGTTEASNEETLATDRPPTIESFSSSDLTSTSAVLHAHIDPQGFATTYHFSYGPTTAYGQTAPQPEGEIATELSAGHSVKAAIEELQPGVTYHFRLIAENKWGTETSEDQSFEFLPPSCPNAAVRQQTGASYLPDCRAYELVSPGNANGTLLYPGGPNTGQATSPSRFAYVGAFSSLPGENVINTTGDLYVATRTDTGWVSHYVGLSGNQAGCVGDPPDEPWSRFGTTPVKVQDQVPTDPSMSRFLDFSDGSPLLCRANGSGVGDATGPLDLPSNVAHMWSAEGAPLATLPTDLPALPDAAASLDCPARVDSPYNGFALCNSAVATSADLSHFVFSSNRLSFSEPGEPAGLTEAPGSAYDDNLATGRVTLISRLPGDQPIPLGVAGEFIRFPAVSADGSHILMSTATAVTGECDNESSRVCTRFTEIPVHLYMSIDDAPAIPIAAGKPVEYVGMTPDGSKVFFTSEEHLTGEDEGHVGASLYMWSATKAEEGKPPLTLISKPDPGSTPEAGDTGNCSPALTEAQGPWTNKCSAVPYRGWAYAQAPGGRGGNAVSDSALAANGDIYFFSPEQLDGDRGVLNQENLYDYSQAEGRLRFIATFPAQPSACVPSDFSGNRDCSSLAIARLEVNPTDTHMAFVTPDQVTSYDNTDTQGSCQVDLRGSPTGETHCTEMYSYTPATGQIVCNSCNPEGQPPTSDVYASQDGLFMTDDGRTFFSTEEALVPQDTNGGTDVYEFVDGRPHLITPGTGTASFGGVNVTAPDQKPGLVGVSANGADVYFSTFDALTSEDHNGDFLKFYDARTNGGFPQAPPVQPCDAAEECHGPTAEAPAVSRIASNGPTATGGNADPNSHHKRKHKRRHNRAAHKHGGKK